MDSNLENILERAGFTKYEKEIYLALHSINEGTVSEIHKRSEVPKPKVYSTLDDLHEKGYIALKGSSPKSYSIIDPESVFSRVIEQKEKELNEAKSILKSSTNNKTSKKEFLELMRGRDTVLNFLAKELEENTQDEYLALLRFHSSSTPLMELMERKMENGCKIKMLGPKKTSKDFVVKKYLNIGAEVKLRDMESIPFRFSIHDSSKLAFTLSDDQNGYLTVWTNYSSFVKNMRQFYQYHWEKAKSPDLDLS